MAVTEAPIVVDISALQSETSRGRGIARYALDWCIALERARPSLVSAYLLEPSLAPPGSVGELVDSGKVMHHSADLVQRATLFHQLCPFDLAQPASSLLPLRYMGQLTSATIYDLIPAKDLANELIDAAERRRYRTRLELVRALDHHFVLSLGVARDLTSILGVDPARISLVGAAAQAAFQPPIDRNHAQSRAQVLLSTHGLSRPYVLYPSGSHPRKNNERLIDAWSKLSPEIKDHYQLVITGAFDEPTKNHLRHLGGQDTIVVPGYLNDVDLVSVVQGAALVCFPSLAEGYGLPVVEAIACETPVIASAISPLDELLPLGQLFDPSDSHQIAAAITTALTKTEQHPHAAIQSWEEVGERTALSFERLLAAADRTKSHRSLRRARPRIAVITPLPPAATGVAQYSYRFIEAMVATEKVDVTCFSDGPTPDQTAPPGTVLHRVEALQHVEYLTGRFDEVIYVLGNSHHHLGAFAMLKKRRGIVMSHDVRLVNLYRHVHGDPGLVPGGLGREIEQMYEHLLPSSLGSGGELSEGDLDRYGLLMARDVIAMSAAFFVTSAAAVTLATIDAQSGTEHHIYALPFAMEEPRIDLPGFEHSTESRPGALEQLPLDLWGLAPPPDAVSYLAHFGIVDPIKRPELLIESIAGLSERPELRLVFVGPISEVMSKQLVDVAIELGVLDRVGFTGPLDPTSYRAWLKSAQIAIQLRAKSNGEASAAVGECLATSLATIVSDTGWSGEIPRDVVRHVPVSISADELAQVVAELLDDPLLRTDLGRASARYCEQHSFDTAARTMLQLIGEH